MSHFSIPSHPLPTYPYYPFERLSVCLLLLFRNINYWGYSKQMSFKLLIFALLLLAPLAIHIQPKHEGRYVPLTHASSNSTNLTSPPSNTTSPNTTSNTATSPNNNQSSNSTKEVPANNTTTPNLTTNSNTTTNSTNPPKAASTSETTTSNNTTKPTPSNNTTPTANTTSTKDTPSPSNTPTTAPSTTPCLSPGRFNASTGNCDCINGSIADPKTSSCVCPPQKPYLSGGECIACLTPSYFEMSSRTCIDCGKGATYNTTLKKCQPIECPSWKILDSYQGQCICPKDLQY